MNLELAFDPLFRVPLLLGLTLAVLLPVLGVFLRVRDEWLGALGYTHVAAAGALASGLLHWPMLLCALGAAAAAALLKGAVRRPGNDFYAAMTIAGWAIALLLAANSDHGEVLGETLLRGQLYFATAPQLWIALGIGGATLGALGWLSPRLLRQRFFPDHYRANRQPAWPHEAAFAALLIGTLVVATGAVGAMAAFALVFVPPWIAFGVCRSWRQALLVAPLCGAVAYLLALAVALGLDQPAGPVIVVALIALLPLRLLPRIR
jgi:zinc/manganese transport system permease protein